LCEAQDYPQCYKYLLRWVKSRGVFAYRYNLY